MYRETPCIHALHIHGGLRPRNDVRLVRPLLPQIATMRMTVLNFSFARKLQSKLSLASSYRATFWVLSPLKPLAVQTPFSRPHFLARMTFLSLGILRRVSPPAMIHPALPGVFTASSGDAQSGGRKRDRRPLKCRYYIQDEFWITTASRWIVKNDRRRS